jgi:REP-associated tyrosine transposase
VKGTYFITASAYMHENLFQMNESADLLLATILRYRDAGEFQLHEFVIMPNHMHLLLSLDDRQTVGRAMQLVKGGFSHALQQAGPRRPAVWQPSYYEHRVRNLDEYRRIRDYIHNNPVRRGLVTAASAYSHSSAAPIVRLDKVPDGLKPDTNFSSFDAALKRRTTDAQCDAGLKARTIRANNVLS